MRRAADAGVPASRMCWDCYSGNHTRQHSQIGCLAHIGPRGDYVCRCEIPGDYRPPRQTVMFAAHQMRRVDL